MTLDQVLSRSYLVGGAVRDELLGLRSMNVTGLLLVVLKTICCRQALRA